MHLGEDDQVCRTGYCLISPGKRVSYTSLDMMETETIAPQKIVPCSAVRIKRDPEGCSYLSGCVFSLEMQPPSGARWGFVLFSLVGRELGGIADFSYLCRQFTVSFETGG